MLTPEEESYIKTLELERDNEAIKSQQLQKEYGQQSMFNQNDYQNNLVEWQLNLREELDRIEHILRGDYVQVDANGNEYWKAQENDDLKPFNEYGVQLVMNVVSFYLNRNTLLSNYKEDDINIKMMDLGEEIADLIFMKYDQMGMDTKEKRKLYPIVSRALIDCVHSAYLRALYGGERESLRTARHVTQSINPFGSNGQQMAMRPQQKQFSIFSPKTWMR